MATSANCSRAMSAWLAAQITTGGSKPSLGVRAMLDLFSVGCGALRGAGNGGGAGDYLPATDDTDLNAAAGFFVAFYVVIVYGVPAF